ncbi:MAG: hypothetical protein LUE24_08255 [Lachnospiraceae bacterium]|nr:hypothetical protein [Lachnospiraceae bacterium]
MKMALKGTTLFIREADETQFTVIKSWNKMKWNRSKQELTGIADMELLDKLNSIVRLPPQIEARRKELHAVADAVDKERMNKDPKPFIQPPVKISMYAHQVRGFNMCLLVFGFVSPEEVSQ